MPGKISASMMCSDLLHIKENISVLEKNHVEYLHIDIMDGDFVPNFGLGVDYIRGLRELTSIPMDLHFMVARPEDKLGYVALRPGDRVHVHFESTNHFEQTIGHVKSRGGKLILALNPETPISAVEGLLEYIDGINVLMVHPGFAGQRLIPSCVTKTEHLVQLLKDKGYENLEVEVDGNISFEHAKALRQIGATTFVAGSSSVFTNGGIVTEEAISSLRRSIE